MVVYATMAAAVMVARTTVNAGMVTEAVPFFFGAGVVVAEEDDDTTAAPPVEDEEEPAAAADTMEPRMLTWVVHRYCQVTPAAGAGTVTIQGTPGVV